MDCKSICKLVAIVITTIAFFVLTGVAADKVYAKDGASSCIECHSQANFRVTQAKLYRYYRDWEVSIHAHEGVTCVNCHGGDPDSTDKHNAHGDGTKKVMTAVEYERVAATCGTCHEENAKHYKESKHYRILVGEGHSHPTPTCITCHGSMNASIPSPGSIGSICAHCHDGVVEDHPEIPKTASYLVGRLSFIDSSFRYLVSRGVLEKSPDFSRKIDNELSELARLWHALELDRIKDKTRQIRTQMMKKGKELREEREEAE